MNFFKTLRRNITGDFLDGPVLLCNLNFLQFKEKIDSIHESVIRGNIREVRGHLDKRGWANARDHYGHSPLHKSVMANQQQIMEFVIKLYPDHLEDRDNVRIFVFTTKYISILLTYKLLIFYND